MDPIFGVPIKVNSKYKRKGYWHHPEFRVEKRCEEMGLYYSEWHECWNLFNYNLEHQAKLLHCCQSCCQLEMKSNIVGWHCFNLRLRLTVPTCKYLKGERERTKTQKLGLFFSSQNLPQNREKKSLAEDPKFCCILTMLISVFKLIKGKRITNNIKEMIMGDKFLFQQQVEAEARHGLQSFL